MEVSETIHWLLRDRGGDGGGDKKKAMARDKKKEAHSVFIRLVLPPYTIHFKSPTYMRDATLDLLDKKVCKETLKSTAQDAVVRDAIGTDIRFWQELVLLFRAAIPSLERRSFTIWDPSSVDYESTSGALIASHYPTLWKDLERLNDLVSISRNLLTIGPAAQDLAADTGLDVEIFRLINCCVRVTARGYDGEAGTGDEEKWQWIVNAYKKLLITNLQYLNNAVAQNERRKLALWVALFDHGPESNGSVQPEDIPETSTTSLTDVPSNPSQRPEPPVSSHDMLLAYGTNGKETIPEKELKEAQYLSPLETWERFPLPKECLDGRDKMEGSGYAMFANVARRMQIGDYQIEIKREPTIAEQFLQMPQRWSELQEDDHMYWQRRYEDCQAKYRQDMAVYEAKQIAAAPRLPTDAEMAASLQEKDATKFERQLAMLQNNITHEERADGSVKSCLGPASENLDSEATFAYKDQPARPWIRRNGHGEREMVGTDMRVLFTAAAGTKILESGKKELMKRLEGYEPPDPNLPPSRNPDNVTTRPVKILDEAYLERTRSMSRSPPIVHPRDPRRQREAKKREQEARQKERDERREARAEQAMEDDILEGEEGSEEGDDDEEEEEEEEEDYPGSTEDGRGLLTDVPLILGPSEIEVLPMLIMSGIVAPSSTNTSSEAAKHKLLNMHTVRTHILLSQTSGRNLLRELLIFVAAWDLREEELYFKFMVKILEAILKAGLMPYCYHSFRDRSRSKDIISPAQAVIMKLLTCIFRGRGGGEKALGAKVPEQLQVLPSMHHDKAADTPPAQRISAPTSRTDLHVLNFIFTEFRQHIIPQTCALIFLQGQIHRGRASPEDFPLNLWDMERMYEGVYQYLEFFAVCCEEGCWKDVLGGWEMGSELVTLLRELEGGIPKAGQQQVVPAGARKAGAGTLQPPQRSMSADSGLPVPGAGVAGERAFEGEHGAMSFLSAPPLPLPVKGASIFEAETPLAFPEDVPPILPSSSHAQLPPPLPPTTAHHDLAQQHDQDEPSDFEWRNLKKLTVLVLSSLVWKNRGVQDQVRDYGGLEALVACCRHDEHNPFIREHAIMCLRFAVERNDANGKVIKEMAKRTQERLMLEDGAGGGSDVGVGSYGEVVPREVLDTGGYETFMDAKGQVGLRRKDGLHYAHAHQLAAPSSSSSTASASAPATASASMSSATTINKPRLSAPKMTAEKAAELMQSALRDLPLGDKLVTEKQKAEALAKLDRAFESTEKALRGTVGNFKGGGAGGEGGKR